MLQTSSIKAVQHLYSLYSLLAGKRFIWKEFVFTSTLQISLYLDLLLDDIESDEVTRKIQLGLHEALVNAVQHGNSGDLSKKLRVRRILTPNWIVWQIQDEGNGVPISSRLASLPSEIDATHGRGLFLIHYCFDDIRWSRKGNRLQLASRRLSVSRMYSPCIYTFYLLRNYKAEKISLGG